MEKREYTILTNDVNYIRELVNKGDLISMKLVFDIWSFSFMYKIKYT